MLLKCKWSCNRILNHPKTLNPHKICKPFLHTTELFSNSQSITVNRGWKASRTTEWCLSKWATLVQSPSLQPEFYLNRVGIVRKSTNGQFCFYRSNYSSNCVTLTVYSEVYFEFTLICDLSLDPGVIVRSIPQNRSFRLKNLFDVWLYFLWKFSL